MGYAVSNFIGDGIEVADLSLVDPHAQTRPTECIGQPRYWVSILAPVAQEQIESGRHVQSQ